MRHSRMLLTGASGRLANSLRGALPPQQVLRLTDRIALTGTSAAKSAEFQQGDLTDPAFADQVTDGVGSIIHLAGDPRAEAPWETLLEANIRATATLFDAARHHGVQKIVYVSSVHAVGGYNDPSLWPVQASWPARPCCRYGASKIAGEAIARLYSDQVPGSSVVCLRLAYVGEAPRWNWETRAWLDTPDLIRLVEAALETDIAYGAYFGVSASSQPRYEIHDAEREIGYVPQTTAPAFDLVSEPRPEYAENCWLWHLQSSDGDNHTRPATSAR